MPVRNMGYVHSVAHQLNLVVPHALTEIKNFIGTVKDLMKFLKYTLSAL